MLSKAARSERGWPGGTKTVQEFLASVPGRASRPGAVDNGACPPSAAPFQILIYPTAWLTLWQALERFLGFIRWRLLDDLTSQRTCVFAINGGLAFFFFPRNPLFHLVRGTRGSLYSDPCDVVNPRSDLQRNPPESDLRSSPTKWFIASACRPLAVSVLAFTDYWEVMLGVKSLPGKSCWTSCFFMEQLSFCSLTGRGWQ